MSENDNLSVLVRLGVFAARLVGGLVGRKNPQAESVIDRVAEAAVRAVDETKPAPSASD